MVAHYKRNTLYVKKIQGTAMLIINQEDLLPFTASKA